MSYYNVSHLSQLLFTAAIQQVLAHIHQLPEENITHLKEASAGGFHQGLENGADVWLDTHFQELLSFGQHQS